MALPMCDQPLRQPLCNQTLSRPALVLASDGPAPRHHPPVTARRPASVYWFRRALAVALLLSVLWASSLLANKLRWTLSPEVPAGHTPPGPSYVIVGDTALPVSPESQ